MNNIETLLNELGQALICSDNNSYNGVSELESAMSYQGKIDKLYTNAVSDLYGMNESQRRIVIHRIDEVRERQLYFDVPSTDTVNAMLRDYNEQSDGKRNKSLLDDYRYCKFVLECVAMQKEYLEKFASLANAEAIQDTVIKSKDIPKIEKDDGWLSVDAVCAKYGLPKNNIKSRKWRIKNNFPFEGFDEIKGSYYKVSFNPEHVENWIKNHK